jgi:ABC-2 type transport system ATP-binding protein
MIKVKNLTKDYGQFRALDGISFSVKKGEILGFLGPNGAGKTTTMRLITGFIKPTEGKIIVSGYDVEDNPLKLKSQIGYLPENLPLYPEMDVVSYLRFVANIKGLERSKINNSVSNVIDMCGLGTVVKRVIANLSKGFKQRVGIAQSLVNDPRVLILDEPSSGLDPKQIIEIRNLIRSLAGDRTIILSSHILPEVQMTCNRVIIINKGKIVAEDEQANLSRYLNRSHSYQILVKRTSKALISFIKNIDGVISVNIDNTNPNILYIEAGTDIRANIIKGLVGQKHELLEFKTRDFSLEDVFLKLTTEEEKTL